MPVCDERGATLLRGALCGEEIAGNVLLTTHSHLSQCDIPVTRYLSLHYVFSSTRFCSFLDEREKVEVHDYSVDVSRRKRAGKCAQHK